MSSSLKAPIRMDSLKLPPRIQRMDNPLKAKEDLDPDNSGWGYQNTLVS